MSKTVLVTGGAKGIGRAICEIFANAGFNVACNYNSSEIKAFEFEREWADKGNLRVFKCDITDAIAVKNMVEKVNSVFGKIDILVNNAGVAKQKLFIDCTNSDIEEMFAVNVFGMMNCSKAVIGQMLNVGGKIVNIASIWGLVGASCESVYSATKSAVCGFTKSLARELSLAKINVNCVAPGVIDTDMLGNLREEDKQALCEQTPIPRLGTTQDVASLVFFLAGEGSDFITGQIVTVDGGFIS